MTLNEAVCMATKNGTHWILKTKSTSCGSLNSFNGNNPIMMNGIHLQFSPGSEFYGYQVRVPFTCKFAPGLFGLPLGKFSHKLSIITIFGHKHFKQKIHK